MKITIAGFAGANKSLHPKLLADTVGQDCANHKPGKGDLRPWRQPLSVATVPAGTQSIYRFGRDVVSDADYWFSWNSIVHAVRGYNTEDTTERTYFTGSGAPKWTDSTLLAGAPYPTATRQLGVPAPATAPVLVASGGVATAMVTRFYVYTYVTDKGEESMPSPVSLELNCKSDDTVAISSIAAPPAGSFTINRVRIYRTQASDEAVNFFFLREIASGVTSTTDDNRVLGEPLQTTTWEMPPATLSYLTPMWNGMLAGISGTGTVRVCEPFAPYAWPPEYEIVPPDTVAKALGRWQQNLLVLTTARPVLVVGTSPDGLDLQPLDFNESCSAPRAVVSFGHGVAWPCPDGLAYYGASGPRMLTNGLFTREEWQAMNPATMVAGQYEGAYLCFYTDGASVRRGFLIDPLNPTGVYYLDQGYDALFFDELQDALYVLSDTSVKKWDAGAAFMTARFTSKLYPVAPRNFGCLQVVGEAYPVTVSVDAGPFSSSELTALVAAQPLLAVNGSFARYTVTVQNDTPVPLPDGFDASAWQVSMSLAAPAMTYAYLADTLEDLA